MNYVFELEELQAIHIVYPRHQRDTNLIPSSIRRLIQQAEPEGLINDPTNKLILVYQHEGKRLSVDISLTMPQEVEGGSEISKGLLSGGLYAIGCFEIRTDKIPAAWSLMHTFTFKRQCKPCAGKLFEIYRSASLDRHPQDRCMIDLCVSVQMTDLKLTEEKTISISTECDIAMLASVTEEGCPRPVPIGKIKAGGTSQIRFPTGTLSDKTTQFRLNSEAGVCFMRGGDSIVLTGKARTIPGTEIKKALWPDWTLAHFPGEVIDPSYCMLEFTSKEATCWIDNELVEAGIQVITSYNCV